MGGMKKELLRLSGLILITPDLYEDERGYFMESCSADLPGMLGTTFVQDNLSFSKQGVIRGLHYQSGPGQAKLVRAVTGKIFDVAVDIRKDSPTYGEWEGITLDDEKCQMLFIPPGFAHGFCVLSERAHVLYKVSTPYCAENEKGFRYDDPRIGIDWPITNPILSSRDLTSARF